MRKGDFGSGRGSVRMLLGVVAMAGTIGTGGVVVSAQTVPSMRGQGPITVQAGGGAEAAAMVQTARQRGQMRVIVGLADPAVPEGQLSVAAVGAQRARLASAQTAVAAGRPFNLAVCDLDRFRQVNVTYGPRIADLALATIAERLRGVGLLPHHAVIGLHVDQLAHPRLAGGHTALVALKVLGDRLLGDPPRRGEICHRHKSLAHAVSACARLSPEITAVKTVFGAQRMASGPHSTVNLLSSTIVNPV